MQRSTFLQSWLLWTFSLLFPGIGSGQLLRTSEVEVFNTIWWREFALEGIYLNAGSLAPVPQLVQKKIDEHVMLISKNPAKYGFGTLEEQAEEVRSKLARFFHCDVSEITTCNNATHWMRMIAQGCRLQKGDHVITTDMEHPGWFSPWEYYQKEWVIELTQIPLEFLSSDEYIIQSIENAITSNTKVVSVSHTTFINGLVLPIKKIGEMLRPKGILLVVDGAQSGVDVNVTELDCDAFTTSLHKWWLAPMGTWALYIRNGDQSNNIRPMELSHGFQVYTGMRGTNDWSKIIGAWNSLDYIMTLWQESVKQEILQLRNMIYEWLKNIPHVEEIVSPEPWSLMESWIVSFTPDPDRLTNGDLFAALRDRWIEGKTPPRGVLRYSPHIYNTPKEIEISLDILEQIMKK